MNIDKFISFVYLNIDGDRIILTKKMKYGYRYYYLTMHLRYDKVSTNTMGTTGESSKELSIVFDTRNQCIEIGQWENYLVFEDIDLLNKWVSILEEYYTNKILINIDSIVNKFLSNTSTRDKDLWRQWSVGKIIDPTED
jgi:hypothetical protein